MFDLKEQICEVKYETLTSLYGKDLEENAKKAQKVKKFIQYDILNDYGN
jgi:hypothetical protein